MLLCYAWDSEERYQRLECVRFRLSGFDVEIKVMLDKHDYLYNQDFDELGDRIWTYDLVVVFCTPDFKMIHRSCLNRDNKEREVLKELVIIEKRYASNQGSVFPVVLEGNEDSVLLDFFVHRHAPLFNGFGLRKNKLGRFVLPSNPSANKEFRKFLERIANLAAMNQWYRMPKYRHRREAMVRLFRLTDKCSDLRVVPSGSAA